MNDCSFTLDQIRREAIRTIGERTGPLDEKFAAYARGIADLCRNLAELTGEDEA